MGELFDKMKAFLDSEEGKKTTIEYFKKLEEKDRKRKEYFESPEFNQILERIKEYLLNSHDSSVQSNSYTDNLFYDFDDDPNSNREPLSDKLFSKVWEAADVCIQDDDKFVDEEIGFSNSNFYYKDFKFTVIIGQGSFYRISLKERVKKINNILK